jgi:hypothetical protein
MKSSLSLFSARQLIPLALLLFQPGRAEIFEGVNYTNFTRPGPIEIHVISIPRQNASLEIRTVHSGGKATGRSPVSEQLKLVEGGKPLAAINGDFFELEGPFAGDPRGLQIVNGALISAPAGSSSFWIDSTGAPHIAKTRSALRITWPDGSIAPLGLNGKCEASELELYTPGLGVLHRENTGREVVLVPTGVETNADLRAGEQYSLKVVEVRGARNEPMPPGTFLLALGTAAARYITTIQPGSVVKISTGTFPALRGVKWAISGGPILVSSGQRQGFVNGASDSTQRQWTVEKHPRSAIGWNKQEYFWVEVDGRRKGSVGMTLSELSALMLQLCCDEAMNLDGGGSSTIWFDGKVRNQPSDGFERPVANSLAVVLKPAPTK